MNPTPIEGQTGKGENETIDKNVSGALSNTKSQQLEKGLKEKKLEQHIGSQEILKNKPSIKGINWQIVVLYTCGLAIGGLFFYLWLRKRLYWWILHLYRKNGDNQTMMHAYLSLLRWTEQRRGRRQEDQTLREYWQSDSNWWSKPTDETIALTKLYEEARYGKNDQKQNYWQQGWILWKIILKQLRP
jgi:hypothetical protein